MARFMATELTGYGTIGEDWGLRGVAGSCLISVELIHESSIFMSGIETMSLSSCIVIVTVSEIRVSWRGFSG